MARASQTTDQPAEEPTEVNAMRARGASWGRHILWVLIISTALAALALLGSYAFHTDDLSGDGSQSRTLDNAAAFDTGEKPPTVQ